MRLARLIALGVLLVAWGPRALADSIPTYYITQAFMTMSPNDGSGDNLSFTFTGPGLKIVGYGGMGCFDWCSGPISTPSGSPGQIYVSNFLSVRINGTNYDPETLSFVSIFLPDGGINGLTTGSVGEGDSFFQFNLISPTNGNWTLSFDYYPAQDGNPPYYLFGGGIFDATGQTPEPGTLSLMFAGLTAIAGVVASQKHWLRRDKQKRPVVQ